MHVNRYAGLAPCFILVAATVTAQEGGNTSPYLPLEVGNKWTYRMVDLADPMRKGEQKVVVQIVKHETLEVKNSKGEKAKVLCAVVEAKSANRTLAEHVAVKPDGLYRYTTAGKEIIPPLRFLKLPPQKGDSWTSEVNVEGTTLKGNFVVNEAQVTVPAGKYQCVTAAATDFQLGDGQKMDLTYWFAPGVGMVKQQVRVSHADLLLELEKFEKGKK